MGLPYSYRGFYETDINFNNFVIKLDNFQKTQKNKVFFRNDNRLTLEFKPDLFGLSVAVTIDFDQNKHGFFYDFSLIFLIKFLIIFIIILAFTISGIKNLLIFSGLAIFVSYLMFIFHTNSKLRDFFSEIIDDIERPEVLSDEQKKWIENQQLCPACGCKIIVYDKFCPDCGLNLKKHRKIKPDPTSRTGYKNYRIVYKNKQENKQG